MLNQEIHKNLRRNKTGIHVNQIEKLSPSYKRPPGFTLLPTLLTASMQNKTLDKNARRQYGNVDANQPVKLQSKMVAAASKLSSKSSAPVKMPSKSEMLR